MANWKEASDCDPGSCVKYGAPDVKQYAQLFNDTNVNTVCFCCATECIQECNVFEFQANCCGCTSLYLQGAGVCFNYRIKTGAIGANKVITIPALCCNDSFTFDNNCTTLGNKCIPLINGCNPNTLTDACASDGDILQYNCTCCRYESRAIRETFMTRFGCPSTTLSSGNGQYGFYMPYNWKFTDVFATVECASNCGNISIQIQQSSLDILSTAITIEANENNSRNATTPPVISDSTLDKNAKITFDLDSTGTAAKGLIIYMIGYQRF